mgnify:CR=1 FL=1
MLKAVVMLIVFHAKIEWRISIDQLNAASLQQFSAQPRITFDHALLNGAFVDRTMFLSASLL